MTHLNPYGIVMPSYDTNQYTNPYGGEPWYPLTMGTPYAPNHSFLSPPPPTTGEGG
jgi:hypothetical protein